MVCSMEAHMIWTELRSQQLASRNKSIFEKYDKIFINELIVALQIYKSKLLDAAQIKSDEYEYYISNTKSQRQLTQFQLALLYHVNYVNKLSLLLKKIFTEACKDPSTCLSLNPTTLFSSIPKREILAELLSGRIPNYGEFLSNLQKFHHDVFTAHNVIIRQAQLELGLNLFHLLRKLFPQILASQGMSNQITFIARDLISRFRTNTEYSEQYVSILVYLKELTKNTSLNIILSIISVLNLDENLANHFANFIVHKTDDVNQESLIEHCTAFADLSLQINVPFNYENMLSQVSTRKLRRYHDLVNLVNKLSDQLQQQPRDPNKIKFLLDQIRLLTPLNSSSNPIFKTQIIPTKLPLFDQSHVIPILNMIRTNLQRNEPFTKSIVELHRLLDHTIQFKESEITELTKKVHARMRYVKQYPKQNDLFTAINHLNISIAAHTSKSWLGSKHLDPEAVKLSATRRELLLLLRDRVRIALKSTPVPLVDNWDSFLTHEFSSPLHDHHNWRNAFFAFTYLGTDVRFPAQLAAQLRALDNINTLKQNIHLLLINKDRTFPERDTKELKINQIVGLKHLQDLYNDLHKKSLQLHSYILYLHITSISSILEKSLATSQSYLALHTYFVTLADTLKKQAVANEYNIVLPDEATLRNIFEQLKKTKITQSHPELIPNQELLMSYYYGDGHQKQSVLTDQPSHKIYIAPISLSRKVLLAFLQLANGITQVVWSMFNKQSSSRKESMEQPSTTSELVRSESEIVGLAPAISSSSTAPCTIAYRIDCTRTHNPEQKVVCQRLMHS